MFELSSPEPAASQSLSGDEPPSSPVDEPTSAAVKLATVGKRALVVVGVIVVVAGIAGGIIGNVTDTITLLSTLSTIAFSQVMAAGVGLGLARYGAFAGGAALLPMTVLIVVLMVAVAPKVIAKLGAKTMITGGLWALAAGLVWLSFARSTGNFVVDVLPASLVAALGQAMAFIPSLAMAISSAKPEEGGLAAGIVSTAYQVGSALGLAAMTAVGLSFGAGRHDDPVALTGGFSAAFLGAAGVALIGGILVMAALRGEKRTAEVPAEEAVAG